MRGLPAVEALFTSYARCEACPVLCRSRSQVVFGSGSTSADLLIIGEVPGEEEDHQGVPFAGRSGRLLMEMLAMVWPKTPEMEEIRVMGAQSDEAYVEYFYALRSYLDRHIFWTNAVLCRTPEGRPPTSTELGNCRTRLMETIYAVDPLLVLAFGKTAASALVGKSISPMDKRGEILDVVVPSPHGGSARYPVMVLLPPSHLLKKGDHQLVAEKKGETYKTVQDLKHAVALLNEEYHDLFASSFPHRPETYDK